MARSPRAFVPGATYHVYSRGSNRQAIFRFDSDRIDFLMCLERALRRARLQCLAYCLMPNHYHLVLETSDDNLSSAMKALNGRYALRFNRRYERDAHLFRNRFGAVLQESQDQLLWTLRYTVRNRSRPACALAPRSGPGVAIERAQASSRHRLSSTSSECSLTSGTCLAKPGLAIERTSLHRAVSDTGVQTAGVTMAPWSSSRSTAEP
jgi:REP element-mobilizing transposase RayT